MVKLFGSEYRTDSACRWLFVRKYGGIRYCMLNKVFNPNCQCEKEVG